MDTDGDGTVSDAEAAAAQAPFCARQSADLRLSVGGTAATLEPTSAAISFPAGLGGLSTMRLECSFVAPLAAPLAASTPIAFEDVSYPERIGWREIIASGDGVSLETGGLPATSVSQRLTSYPADLISQPLDVRSAALVATSVTVPAATPVPAAAGRGRGAGAGLSGRRGRGPGRDRRRRRAIDLPRGRPHPVRPAPLARDRVRPRRGPRPDARPWQDPDGGVPRRDARNADPRRWTGTVGHGVAYAGHPRHRRARGRRAGPACAGRRRPCGAGDRRRDDRRAGRLDAPRRGAEAARGAADRPRPTSATTTRHARARARRRARARPRARGPLARRRRPQPRPVRRLDAELARPLRPGPRRRPDPLDQRAVHPARLDRRGAAGVRVPPGRDLRPRHGRGDDVGSG